MMSVAASVMLGGCMDLEEVRILDPSSIVPPVLNPFDLEAVEVTNETLDKTLTFAWDEAYFGVQTHISYSIEATYGDSPKVVLFSGLSGTSASITYEDLNYTLALDPALGGLGVPLDTPSEVNYYISASIGNSADKYYSEPRALAMTVIYAEPIYPKVWVIGDFCGWVHDSSQYLFSFNYDANYEGVVYFGSKASNGFKITGAASWENTTGNWGYEGQDDPEAETITLTNGATTNIMLYSRPYYSFKYNTSTRVLTKQMSFDKVTCTINGAEEDMSFNTLTQRFYLDKTLAESDVIVFTIVDGDNRTVLGSLEDEKLNGGEADAITAGVSGNYRILVNLNNSADRTYRFSAEEYMNGDGGMDPDQPGDGDDETASESWGIVGGPNGWGNTPDLVMEEEGGFYVYKGLALEAGSDVGFKIRFNNEWNDAANYGVLTDDPAVIGPDGNPVETSGGSKNIYVTAPGTFDVYFNLAGKMVYLMNAGDPAPVFDTWGVWRNGYEQDITMTEEGSWYVARDVELNGEIFKIRYASAWDQDYGTALSYENGVPVGAAVLMNPKGVDMSGLTGTFDIYFNPTDGIIQINEAGEPAPEPVSWGIAGSVTSWGDYADLTMVLDGGSYVCRNLIFTGPDNGEFKIRANSSWEASLAGTYASSGSTFNVYAGGANISVPAGTYDVWFNPSARTVTINAVGSSYVADWYLYGNFGGNTTDWTNVEMASASVNIKAYMSASVSIPDDGQFLYKSGDETQWLGPDRSMASYTDPYTLTIGTAFTTSADKVNARIPAGGTYDFWLLPEAGRAYVMPVGVKPEYVPDTWGICGSISGWGDLGDFAMSDNGDGTYTRRDVRLSTSDEFKVRFGNAWDRQYSVNGTASEGVNNVTSDGGAGNTRVAADGVYDITINPAAATMTLTRK